MIINTFKAELHKYLAEIKSYYPDQIVSLIVTYIFFMGFFIGLSKTELGQENLHIGFIFWFFASTIISEASISISYEKQTGTFEQLLLKPTHILCILSVKTLVWFIVSLVKVTILMIIVMLTIGIILPFNIKILPILFVTLVGLYGLGLILSGLT
ncbi:ABC transporter permease, partial [Caloranaerobacter sp. DY30410]|uniref:ABC transporter permease n=1 Tax=Caloranaerobacter sp. DY30410 TaxID=3238305 RepID=UPI003D058CC6